jgi:signal transduction histidine kinase
MGEREIIIFIVIANIILLVFIGGIIAFIFQFRKRKVLHNQEKEQMNQGYEQQLLEKQLETQFQTMKDIGQEIHDNIGQKLTLASIYTQQMAHTSQQAALKENLENIGKIINDSIHDLRQLSKTLVNPVSPSTDLLELLNIEAEQLRQVSSLKLRIHCTENRLDFDNKTRNSLHRIAQEFIQNTLKHAQARNIDIRIDKITDQTKITLTDDGKGFDTQQQNLGIGLVNMRRRALELGGTCEVVSQINGGTILTLIF